MGAIEYVMIEAADPVATQSFCEAVFSLGERVRVRGSEASTSGLRGFTLSLVVSQPAAVRDLIDRATTAGATVVKPAAKSLWGYGGAIQGPDGTIWTLASTSKKDTAPATRHIESFVLQLGVADVSASKQFYVDHGFAVTKSYGRKYVEFDTGEITLTLLPRDALAKAAGVSAEGGGSHRLAIAGDVGAFTDSDGFVWESSVE